MNGIKKLVIDTSYEQGYDGRITVGTILSVLKSCGSIGQNCCQCGCSGISLIATEAGLCDTCIDYLIEVWPLGACFDMLIHCRQPSGTVESTLEQLRRLS